MKTNLFPVVAAVLLLAACHPSKTIGDPVITEALESVSEDTVRSYIDDLVGFHTRHTLSVQNDPQKGLGAAIDYLARRCEAWAETAPAGRPKPLVEKVRYVVGQNGGRYDRAVSVPELIVTLPGTDGSREIILMAHVDTRVIDVMDSTAFAPGADDDGSGVACLL